MAPFSRPTIAEIDLDSLAHNYQQIRSRVHPQAQILAVVKDNAYGHGAVTMARELERLGVDLLGVAIADEGIELRDGGVKRPILILSGIYEEEIDRVVEYDLRRTFGQFTALTDDDHLLADLHDQLHVMLHQDNRQV